MAEIHEVSNMQNIGTLLLLLYVCMCYNFARNWTICYVKKKKNEIRK